MNTTDDLRGVFFITKGSFRKKDPKVLDDSGEEHYIGGYDPSSEETAEWYRVMDCVKFNCVGTSDSLEQALDIIRNSIIKYRSRRKYFSVVEKTTRFISSAQILLEKCIYEHYGDYFSSEVEEVENEAYEEVVRIVKENRLVEKTKKRLTKTPVKKSEIEVEDKKNGLTPANKVKVKPRIGLLKIN